MTSDEIEVLLDQVEDAGCGCDAQHGYRCGIHEPLNKLRDALVVRTGALEATTVPDATGFSVDEGIKSQGF